MEGSAVATPRGAFPPLPPDIFADSVALNGEPFAVDPATGLLPSYPGRVQGRSVSDPASPLVLPPLSYGFVILPEAAAAACLL